MLCCRDDHSVSTAPGRVTVVTCSDCVTQDGDGIPTDTLYTQRLRTEV